MAIWSIVGSVLGGIFGKKKKAKAADTKVIDYRKLLEDQRKEFERQMVLQAQESKRRSLMLAVGIGGGLILLLLVMMIIKK